METTENDIHPDIIKTLTIDEQVLPIERFSSINGGTQISTAFIQSPNYLETSTGWKLDKSGNFEANTGTFRGALVANTLDIPDTTTANSFHVDADGNAWWGATTLAGAVGKVLKTGDATFSSIIATGTINALGGYIGSASAISVESSGLAVGTTGYIRGGQTDYNTGTGFFLGYSGGSYKLSIGTSGINNMTWDGSSLSVLGNIQAAGSFTSGMTLSTNDAVLIGDNAQTDIISDTSTTDDAIISLGQVSGNSIVSQKITVPATTGGELITQITIRVRKQGTPADNLVLTIETLDGSSHPTGTIAISCGTLAGGSITGSFATYDFTFSGVVLSASTSYGLVFKRSGSADSSNYYDISAYSIGSGDRASRYDGSWTDLNAIVYHKISQKFLLGSVYKASAGSAKTSNTFIGFALANGTYGNSINIQTLGVNTGLSSLSTGAIYYLSNTFGAISTSAGVVSKKIGIALATTRFNILYTI